MRDSWYPEINAVQFSDETRTLDIFVKVKPRNAYNVYVQPPDAYDEIYAQIAGVYERHIPHILEAHFHEPDIMYVDVDRPRIPPQSPPWRLTGIRQDGECIVLTLHLRIANVPWNEQFPVSQFTTVDEWLRQLPRVAEPNALDFPVDPSQRIHADRLDEFVSNVTQSLDRIGNILNPAPLDLPLGPQMPTTPRSTGVVVEMEDTWIPTVVGTQYNSRVWPPTLTVEVEVSPRNGLYETYTKAPNAHTRIVTQMIDLYTRELPHILSGDVDDLDLWTLVNVKRVGNSGRMKITLEQFPPEKPWREKYPSSYSSVDEFILYDIAWLMDELREDFPISFPIRPTSEQLSQIHQVQWVLAECRWKPHRAYSRVDPPQRTVSLKIQIELLQIFDEGAYTKLPGTDHRVLSRIVRSYEMAVPRILQELFPQNPPRWSLQRVHQFYDDGDDEHSICIVLERRDALPPGVQIHDDFTYQMTNAIVDLRLPRDEEPVYVVKVPVLQSEYLMRRRQGMPF